MMPGTGANSIPLGPRKPYGGMVDPSSNGDGVKIKNENSDDFAEPGAGNHSSSRDRERRRDRRSGSRDRGDHRSKSKRSRRSRSRDRDRSSRRSKDYDSHSRRRDSRDRSDSHDRDHSRRNNRFDDTGMAVGVLPAPGVVNFNQQNTGMTPTGPKKRKSRWANESEKVIVPGLPTIIPPGLSEDQQKAYLLQLQIEDCSTKLRTGNLGIPVDPNDRSPSPPPVYDGKGMRLNTRDVRTKQKYETMRHTLIQDLTRLNPTYKPPTDYRAPYVKLNAKVWIPQDDYPNINFVGLLIGPRGNTLKQLEKDTGAKVIIRGKGSVKEGKVVRKDGNPLPGEDEPLHAYITATTQECIDKAVTKVETMIQEGIDVPEGQSELRKQQLRELAILNGTLRPEDAMMVNIYCTNCGENTHKTWECMAGQNITHTIICTVCGGVGHLGKDCKSKGPGASFMGMDNAGGPPVDHAAASNLDDEYSALMAELGGSSGSKKANEQTSKIKQQSFLTVFGGNRKVQPLMNQQGGGGSMFQQQMPRFPPMHHYPQQQQQQQPVQTQSPGYNFSQQMTMRSDGGPRGPPRGPPTSTAAAPVANWGQSMAMGGFPLMPPPPPPPISEDGGDNSGAAAAHAAAYNMGGWGYPAPVPAPQTTAATNDWSAYFSNPVPPPPPPPSC